jgi:hypothetical protein
MSESVVIQERFCGFPRLALGGYVGGVLAKAVGRSVEVRLLKPVRIGARLDLERPDPDRAVLRDAEETVAEARVIRLDIGAPAVVGLAETRAASRSYPGFDHHLFSGCFCCGPSRAAGDGLRIFPGLVPGRNTVAAVWAPHASVADADGNVWMEAVWSALDCPGLWALVAAAPADSATQVVTGTLAAEAIEPLRLGEKYIVLGWPLGRDGRKLFAGAAVMSIGGDLHALAKQTCVNTARGVPLGLGVWRTPPA